MNLFRPFLIAAALACALPALADTSEPDTKVGVDLHKVASAAGDAVRQTREGLGDAALSPLEDLNLRKDGIPPLLEAIEDPFAPLAEPSCPLVNGELIALASVLGPEPVIGPKEKQAMSEKLADRAASETLKTVASQARDLIPYRGLLRQASGADKHAKTLRQAFERGQQRRAYLKGLSAAMACAPGTGTEPAGLPVSTLPPLAPTETSELADIAAPPSVDLSEVAYLAPPPPPPVIRPSDRTSSLPSASEVSLGGPESAPRQWPPEG